MQECGLSICTLDINKLKERVKLEGMGITPVSANIHAVPCLEHGF
jgi:hypothetical protein